MCAEIISVNLFFPMEICEFAFLGCGYYLIEMELLDADCLQACSPMM